MNYKLYVRNLTQTFVELDIKNELSDSDRLYHTNACL